LNITRPPISELIDGIKKSDRIALAKAITLVESTLPSDQEMSSRLIDELLPHSGNSIRIGITGIPGVGKSTFIEAFGAHVTDQNKKIAVLTVDPSSLLTKGSILGDKTRMDTLAKNKLAFIRPSASGNTLGGVTNNTRQAILLCEAAGFEIIVVETVGVGQSEVAVKNMVDFFLLLMLARAGDELQGIKKGITEMADAIVITKADGDNKRYATQAQAEYQHALHLHASSSSEWNTKVLTCSAFTGEGISEIWSTIKTRIEKLQTSGGFEKNRQQQNLAWFQEYFDQLLKNDIDQKAVLKRERDGLINELKNQNISVKTAAEELLRRYHDAIRKGI
jgi:LAO/AO transport system kinase